MWRILNFLGYGISDKLKILLKLRSQYGIELHVEEGRKRRKQIKTKSKEISLSLIFQTINFLEN